MFFFHPETFFLTYSLHNSWCQKAWIPTIPIETFRNLAILSWIWRACECKSSWNFSTQCNSWCLFIKLYKIIKSLFPAGFLSSLSRKSSSTQVKGNFHENFALSSCAFFCTIFDLAISFYFMSLRLLNVCSLNWYSYFIHPRLRSYHHYERHIDVDFPPHLATPAKVHKERKTFSTARMHKKSVLTCW